jgi:hypothetical protein
MRGLYSLHLILYTREAAHSSQLKLFLWAISLWEGSRSAHTGYHACAGQVLHRKLSGPGTLTASIVTTTTRKQRAGMPICPPVRSCRYRGLHRCHLYIDTLFHDICASKKLYRTTAAGRPRILSKDVP